MALSRSQEKENSISISQKDSIERAINHFLDFPKESELFLLAEKSLLSALTTEVPEDHEFYLLGECFKKPESYFQGLENENQESETTIGAVQNFMLDRIEKSLSGTGNPLLHWDQKTILDLLPETNWLTIFKSKKAFVEEGDNPHQLPEQLPGKNYKQVFRTKDTKHGEVRSFIDVTVSISAILVKKQSVKFEYLRTDFEDDDEEDEYMEKILAQAAIEAKYTASMITLNALKKKKIISKKKIKQFMGSEANTEIITQSYWSNLLFLKALPFSKIMQLTDVQNENLSEPCLIDLHKNKVFTFDEIKSLTSSARLVAKNPAYYESIKNKTIKLTDLMAITQRRAKLLGHPHITCLILNKKIDFMQVKHMPYHLKTILTNAHYFHFFQKNSIDWDEFIKIKPTHCEMMLKPYMVCLVSNQILTLKNLTSAMNMYPNPDQTFYQLMASASAKRLYRLCVKRPSRINAIFDTFDLVMGELPDLAKKCDADPSVLKTRTFLKLLAYLGIKVKKNIRALLPEDPRITIYTDMYTLIQKSHASKNEAESVLTELQVFAKETLQSLPNPEPNACGITLFPKKRKTPMPDTDVRDLCEAIISITVSTLKVQQSKPR